MVDFSGILPVIGGAFVDWLQLFVAPLRNLDMLWIIVPIWGVWLFSEFYQEKKGTSFGNAISNGATMLFVGVDWTRHIISDFSAGSLPFGLEFIMLITLAAVVLVYGLAVITLGIKANRLAKIIGRVRETTYFMVMFSPVIYGVEEFTIKNAMVMLAFFPVFYILIGLVDRLMPTPRTFDEDEGMKLDKELGIGSLNAPGLASDFGQDVFAVKQPPQQQQQWQRQPYPGYPGGFQQQNLFAEKGLSKTWPQQKRRL